MGHGSQECYSKVWSWDPAMRDPYTFPEWRKPGYLNLPGLGHFSSFPGLRWGSHFSCLLRSAITSPGELLSVWSWAAGKLINKGNKHKERGRMRLLPWPCTGSYVRTAQAHSRSMAASTALLWCISFWGPETVGKVKKEKRPAYVQQSTVQLQRAWYTGFSAKGVPWNCAPPPAHCN